MVPGEALPRGRRRNTPEDLAAIRAATLDGLKDRPGIYKMLDQDGGILYVGKSKRLRARLQSYFRCDKHEKGGRIVREASRIEWEYCPSEFAALLTELRLIKRYRPRFNVAMKRDDRHYAFIKVTRGPAPKLFVTRGSQGARTGGLYYGPFVGAARVRDAVRALNDALGLRDCAEDTPMHFSDQQELFSLGRRTPGCIRYEVKKCLGPCVAACAASEYDVRVRLARAFLEGHSDEPIERFRKEMDAASARLEFERATAFRDRLRRLEALREQFGRLRFALESLSFRYTVPGHAGDDRVYLVRRGSVRAEAPAPRTDDDRLALDRLAAEVFSHVEPAMAPVPTHEIDEILLLSSWFNRFPEELERTERLPAPTPSR